MRIRTASAVLISLIPVAAASASATAATGPGGAAPTASAPSSSSTGSASGGASPDAAPSAPKVPAAAAPITARSRSVAYHGAVYEKTLTGEVVPYPPTSDGAPESALTGGSPVGEIASTKPELLVPGKLARYVEGLAAAPMDAPAAVQEIIWAANELIGLPYIYGGGHNATFTSPGYDCSGTVSFALHGARLLKMPEDSSEFEHYGDAGEGRWVTIFANPGHAYMTVAGLRLDTSPVDDPSNEEGPRWRPLRPANPGFVLRHPVGL